MQDLVKAEQKGSMLKKKSRFAVMMTSPTIVIFLALTLFPLLFTLFYSFTDYYFLAKKAPEFLAVKNYLDLFKNTYFRKAIWNTVKFVLLAVSIETVLGLLLAVFLNSITRFSKALRTAVLLPALMPPVTVALVWQIMLSNNHGLVNEILGIFGVPAVNWLMNVKTAFGAILVIDIWQYVPISFLLIYATLQSIPTEQYEAAEIDGATGFKQFFYITLPNIKSGILMVILMRTMDTFRLFDKVNILTKGGPSDSTSTMTQFIYQQGVRGLKVGYASAASVIMTLIVLIFSIIYIRKMMQQAAGKA